MTDLLRSDRSVGILLMLAGAMVGPFVDASAKAFALAYSAIFLTWARFYSLTLVLGLVTLVRHGHYGLLSNAPRIHMARGALYAVSSGLVFLSLGFLVLTTAAFRRAEASLLAPFRYAEIFVAVAIGVLWFGELPHTATLVGSGLIIVGGLISSLRRHPYVDVVARVSH